jgi:integrase
MLPKGYVFKRKRSPFYQVKFRPRAGQEYVYLSTGETNRIAAATKAKELIEDYIGRPAGASKGAKLTIGEFCRLPDPAIPADEGGGYLQYVNANRAGNTRLRYTDILRTQIIPTFGHLGFEEVSPLQVEQWKQKRLKEVEKATVVKELNTCSNIFKIARKIYQYTRANPVADIEKPTVPKRKKRIPSPTEMQRFLHAAAQLYPKYFPPFLVLYQCGLRIDELRHLEPGDVDLERDILHIRVKKGWSPKDAEDRDVPITEPLRSVLLKHLTSTQTAGRWLFPRFDRRTIYCKRCGRAERHLGNLRKTIIAIGKEAKIPQHVTHHILRHCNSTHSRKLGALDYEVMELLGQKSTKVHGDYTHAEWSGMVDASRRLGESFEKDLLKLWSAQRMTAHGNEHK